MRIRLEEITLVLGVDAQHLEELRWTWPSWMRFKPEILQMPLIVFYDSDEVVAQSLSFLDEHCQIRLIPWKMVKARNQREEMLNGWLQIPASEVETPWYLKLDTDTMATSEALWIKDEWFVPNEIGEYPVFVSSKWGYTKPRYAIDLLDDWADGVPELSCYQRLELPYSSESKMVRHPRIISWLFFGRTDWTRKAASWLEPSGTLPYPSQDTYLFYCAARTSRFYVRASMNTFGWRHIRANKLEETAVRLGFAKARWRSEAPRGLIRTGC